MRLFGIGLHKISLGALILSLGLLVDDAIIAVEMMAIKLEQGFDRVARRRASPTHHRVPDADRHAGDGRRASCRSRRRRVGDRRVHALDLRRSSTIALIVSWVARSCSCRTSGYKLLPDYANVARRLRGSVAGQVRRCTDCDRAWRCRRRGRARPATTIPTSTTPFYRRFRRFVDLVRKRIAGR